jgi:hypothetical protein
MMLRGVPPSILGRILSRLEPWDFRHHVLILDSEDGTEP